MTDRDTIFEGLRDALPDLKRRYPIRSLGVFGSLARGDDRADSDVDILVEFAQPVPLSVFLALENRLREVTRRDVDLATPEALKRYMRENAMRDLIAL